MLIMVMMMMHARSGGKGGGLNDAIHQTKRLDGYSALVGKVFSTNKRSRNPFFSHHKITNHKNTTTFPCSLLLTRFYPSRVGVPTKEVNGIKRGVGQGSIA